jgi:hypothetical protein
MGVLISIRILRSAFRYLRDQSTRDASYLSINDDTTSPLSIMCFNLQDISVHRKSPCMKKVSPAIGPLFTFRWIIDNSRFSSPCLSSILRCKYHSRMPTKRPNRFSKSNPSGAKRAKEATEYAAATEPRLPDATPSEKLLKAQHAHHAKVPPGSDHVVHWFRSDLRLEDNRALSKASDKARENGKSLIALYIMSPQVVLRSHRLIPLGLAIS